MNIYNKYFSSNSISCSLSNSIYSSLKVLFLWCASWFFSYLINLSFSFMLYVNAPYPSCQLVKFSNRFCSFIYNELDTLISFTKEDNATVGCRCVTICKWSSTKRKYTITNYFTFNDEAELNISPNPASNQTELTYRFPSPVAKPFLIISDMNGKQILSKSISLNESTLTIQTSDMQQGVYHVQLMDGRSLLKSIPLVIIK